MLKRSVAHSLAMADPEAVRDWADADSRLNGRAMIKHCARDSSERLATEEATRVLGASGPLSPRGEHVEPEARSNRTSSGAAVLSAAIVKS